MDTTKYRHTLATCDCAAWLTALVIYDDLPEGHPLEAHAYIAYRKGVACSKEEVMALVELLERPAGSKRANSR